MKTGLITIVLLLVFVAGSFAADEKITVIAPTTEAGEGLDLKAVAELFKESATVEDFERELNNPRNGINNLDLNEDGYIDFIRVVDYAEGETHVLILQVPLGEDEFQDVATIEIEREDDAYNLQIHGNDEVYGADYYYQSPVRIHIHLWPILTWVYGPRYRPYRSVYYWGHYPGWWRPWRPVSLPVYRSRYQRYYDRTNFVFARKTHVHSAHRIYGKPRSSHRAVKKNKAARRHSWEGDRRIRGSNRGRTAESTYRRNTESRRGPQSDRSSGRTRSDSPRVRNKSNSRGEESYRSKAGRRQANERETGKPEVRKGHSKLNSDRGSSRHRLNRSSARDKKTEVTSHKNERHSKPTAREKKSRSKSSGRNAEQNTRQSERRRRS